MMNHTACVVCGNHDICVGSVVVDCPVITAEEQRRFTGEDWGGLQTRVWYCSGQTVMSRYPYAIKTQQRAIHTPSRRLWVPGVVSLWYKRAGVATP